MKKLPYKCYLRRCNSQFCLDDELGFIYTTLKKAEKGNCEDCTVIKVELKEIK